MKKALLGGVPFLSFAVVAAFFLGSWSNDWKTTEKNNYVSLKQKLAGFEPQGPNPMATTKKRTGVHAVIDTATAIRFIRQYNERYNPALNSTAFIDLDQAEVMAYLDEVTKRIPPAEKNPIFRIYLADRGNAVCAVITSVTEKGETYLSPINMQPLDWGSLCPPPLPCVGSKAYLFERAIAESSILKKVASGQ